MATKKKSGIRFDWGWNTAIYTIVGYVIGLINAYYLQIIPIVQFESATGGYGLAIVGGILSVVGVLPKIVNE